MPRRLLVVIVPLFLMTVVAAGVLVFFRGASFLPLLGLAPCFLEPADRVTGTVAAFDSRGHTVRVRAASGCTFTVPLSFPYTAMIFPRSRPGEALEEGLMFSTSGVDYADAYCTGDTVEVTVPGYDWQAVKNGMTLPPAETLRNKGPRACAFR